jgi:hypothetical protein
MQARWQVLNEEIDCTEEEQFLFASLQLQVGLQANVPQPKVTNSYTKFFSNYHGVAVRNAGV